MQTGWIGTGQDEAIEAQEILARSLLPDLSDERRELEARRAAEAKAADRADEAAVRAFLGGGSTAGEVLARGEDPVDRDYRRRLTRARELLAREGLQDLLGGSSGVIDQNVGFLASRSALTKGDAVERAIAGRDRRAREQRESVGVEAIARARAARPPSWGERMRSFIAGD